MARDFFSSNMSDPENIERLRRFLAPPAPLDTPEDTAGDPAALGAMTPAAPEAPAPVSTSGQSGANPLGLSPEIARRFLAARQQGESEAWANHAGSVFDAVGRNILSAAGVHAAPVVVDRPGLADKPVNDLEQQLRLETMATRKIGAPGKPPPPGADSPEAKALQAAWKARHPETPDAVLAVLTPGNFESWRKDFATGAEIDSREKLAGITDDREKKRLEQQAEQFAQRRGFDWAKLSQDERLAIMRLSDALNAREAAAAEKEKTKQEESNVPGFEPAPGATPTKNDAETLKKMNESAARMRRNLSDLKALHAQYGDVPKGSGATRQQQALRAVQIEAKNIAGLGALSGPDFGLLQDISTSDLNSLPGFLQRTFGGASLEESIAGMERWVDNNLMGTAEGRGYRPKTVAKPTQPLANGARRVPAATALPTGPDGKPTLDAPPPIKTSKRYSPSKDTTYLFDGAGNLVGTEKGDTRGR